MPDLRGVTRAPSSYGGENRNSSGSQLTSRVLAKGGRQALVLEAGEVRWTAISITKYRLEAVGGRNGASRLNIFDSRAAQDCSAQEAECLFRRPNKIAFAPNESNGALATIIVLYIQSPHRIANIRQEQFAFRITHSAPKIYVLSLTPEASTPAAFASRTTQRRGARSSLLHEPSLKTVSSLLF